MKGCVRLHVEGLMLEKLIARAQEEGAVFARIERLEQRKIAVCADERSAAILGKLCEKYSIECELIHQTGGGMVVRRLRRRATMLGAFLVFLLATSAFLSRVWVIEVSAVAGMSDAAENISGMLTDMGIRAGMAVSDVDASMIENALYAKTDEFSFIGVSLQGVRLLVEATAAEREPPLYSIDDNRDLVARCDGIVEEIRVLSGTAGVKPGDTVVKGQVLISGNERISKEDMRGISALGSVRARTWQEGAAQGCMSAEVTERTGRSSTSAQLCLFGCAWSLAEGEQYDTQESETEIIPVGGMFLPLEVRRTVHYETTRIRYDCDEEKLKAELAAMAYADAACKLRLHQPYGCEISGRWIEYQTDPEGVLHARAVFETYTDIAISRDVLYSQGGNYIGNE